MKIYKTIFFNADRLFYLISIILISLFTYQILIEIVFRNFEIITDATYSIIEGKCYGVNETWQNRLLGPYIIYLISLFKIISFSQSIKLFLMVFLIINAFTMAFLIKKTVKNNFKVLILLIIYFFAFLILQKRIILPFDLIDMLVFTLVAYGIIENKKTNYFFLIFLIALINRESAIFIGVFVLINSFDFSLKKLKIENFETKNFLIGLMMIIASLIFVKLTRTYLYNDTVICEDDFMLFGNFIYLLNNFYDIFYLNLFSPHQHLHMWFIFGVFLFFYKESKFFSVRMKKCFLVLIIIFINILIFGIFNEKRVHLIMLPFFMFMFIEINKRKQII